MKSFTATLICLFFLTTLSGQIGGMRVYGGISTLSNKDKIANPEGFSHTGYHFGADARLNSGGMAFLVGARFTSISSNPIEDFKLSGHESTLTVLNGRGGLDISIYSISNIIRIRTKALASFDVVMSQSGPKKLPPGYKLNDGWLGFVTGLGADLGPAIIDLEYEFGVINGYNKIKGSNFDSFTVSVGFFF